MGSVGRRGLVSARGFDPEQPVDRPVRTAAPLSESYVWGRAELARLESAILRGHRPCLPFAAAISVDALLAAERVEVEQQLVAAGRLQQVDHLLGGPADSRPTMLAGLVKQLQRRGFAVHGIFTLGQDHDDVGCFERLVAWVEAQGLVTVELRLWTPDPSSSVVRQLARQDRILHRSLERWDGAHVVVTPKQMSAQTLYRGWVWAQRRLGSITSFWRRRPRERAALLRYVGTMLASKLAPLRAQARVRERLLPAFASC